MAPKVGPNTGNNNAIQQPQNNKIGNHDIRLGDQPPERGGFSLLQLVKSFFSPLMTLIFGTPEAKAEREQKRAEKSLTGSLNGMGDYLKHGAVNEGVVDNCLNIAKQARKLGGDNLSMYLTEKLSVLLSNFSVDDLKQMQKFDIPTQRDRMIEENTQMVKSSVYHERDPYKANLKNMDIPQESESTKQMIKERADDIRFVMDLIHGLLPNVIKDNERATR